MYQAQADKMAAAGNHQAAILCYNSMLEFDPNDAECYCRKGEVLAALGKNMAATDCYDAALKIDSGLVGALLGRARAMRARGYV